MSSAYINVKAESLEKLDKIVNELMGRGWLPKSGAWHDVATNTYMQTMVRATRTAPLLETKTNAQT